MIIIKLKFLNNKYIRVLFNLLIIFLFTMIASGIGGIFYLLEFSESNTVIIYLLFVFLSTLITKNLLYGPISSLCAVFAYNFFFTDPYFSFKVKDPAYIITFFVMAITSLVTSILLNKLQKTSKENKEKSIQTQALYNLTSHFTDAKNIEDIVKYSVQTISETFNTLAAMLKFTNDEPDITYLQQKSLNEQVYRETINPQEIKSRMNNLITAYDDDGEFYNYPLYTGNKLIAVLRIPSNDAKYLTSSQDKLLHSILESVSIAMDSFILEQEKEKVRIQAEKEQYKSNLLRSISHDLRTPLSEIIGTSEIMMNISKNNEEIYTLSNEVHESAEWLHSLVENILNLTKIQNGKLVINKTLESIEEIVAVAVSIIEKRYVGRSINIDLPDDPVFASVDARLINQVLVNLLDNAVKHTPSDKQVGITIVPNDKTVSISVYDEGCGISEKDLPYIFQTFYTTSSKKSSDSKRGIGLGLAIVESIVKAHGGTITCKNRENGGAIFTFTLNTEEEN